MVGGMVCFSFSPFPSPLPSVPSPLVTPVTLVTAPRHPVCRCLCHVVVVAVVVVVVDVVAVVAAAAFCK